MSLIKKPRSKNKSYVVHTMYKGLQTQNLKRKFFKKFGKKLL